MNNIILCGGTGTLLWPLSRTMLPKQFVRLFDGKSLFQDTVLRNAPLCSQSIIVSNRDQYFLGVDQLDQIESHSNQFFLEPVGRNTAPVIALACMALDDEELVFVTTSDHLVKDQAAYEKAVLEAKALAEQDNLVTCGIQPDYPETGFGYIESKGHEVLSFKEKPDAETAQSYIDQGNYYWNSGMFCFKTCVFLEELQKYVQEMHQACLNAISKNRSHFEEQDDEAIHASEIRIDLEAMLAIPDNSIDYAVMEKSQKVKVVPCDMGWSDLGSFDALFDEIKQPGLFNAILPRLDESPQNLYVQIN